MKYAFVVCLIGLVVGSAEAQVTTHGMTVTPGPVFWSGSRLAAAQARYTASPGTYGLVSPMGGTTHRVLQMAFQYRMTGTCAAANGFSNAPQIDTCGDAIAWLLNTTDCGGGCRNEYLFPGGASATTADYRALDDHARWLGEIAILGYSWLRDQLSPADRQALLGRLVRAAAATATKDWGAPVDPANNYMWGYTRNLIETALVLAAQESNATYAPVTVNCAWSPGAGANPMNLCNDSLDTVVDELLDEGIDVRWTGHLLPHLNGPAKGGVLNEGQNYGHYLLNYMTVPMMLMEDYGRVAREETPYWKEAVWALIYATSNRAIYPVQAGRVDFWSAIAGVAPGAHLRQHPERPRIAVRRRVRRERVHDVDGDRLRRYVSRRSGAVLAHDGLAEARGLDEGDRRRPGQPGRKLQCLALGLLR